MSRKKSKCGKCHKNMPLHLRIINCDTCKKYFHVKCWGTSKNKFLQLKIDNEKWICSNCVSNVMPFSSIDNYELFLDIRNKSNLISPPPSFTIHSLLDQMPGQNFETDEFMRETISSKYFTPSEFLECKFPPNKFCYI